MSILFWPLLFLGLGLLLLILEVFIPSGGMIGLGSILCLLLCLWYAYEISPTMLATFMLVDLVVLPLAAALAFSLWSRSPVGRKVLLQPPTSDEIDVSHEPHRLERLLDRQGVTLSPLRPSGVVEFDGRRIDGLAEEGFLPAGLAVRAVRVRSGQLVVRRSSGPWEVHGPAPAGDGQGLADRLSVVGDDPPTAGADMSTQIPAGGPSARLLPQHPDISIARPGNAEAISILEEAP